MNSITFAPLKLSTLKTRQDGSQYRLIHPIATTREWERHVSTPNNRSDVFRVPKRFPQNMISLVVTLIVIGVLLWLVNTYIPMDAKIKQILNVVVVICVVLYVLSAFGLFHHADIPIPQVR